jgi:hypothetical protein
MYLYIQLLSNKIKDIFITTGSSAGSINLFRAIVGGAKEVRISTGSLGRC